MSSETFAAECVTEIQVQGRDEELMSLTRDWMNRANSLKYSYHFNFLGRPLIQYPQDIVAMQQIIWDVKPDLIIETGIAHGGSLILNASMLALLDYCDAVDSNNLFDPKASGRMVLGIDIDIRSHNRAAIEAHSMAHKIEMIEGSSIDPMIIERVRNRAKSAERVLVSLDSNHTHDHVLAELHAYADLTSIGSYCVVFDTVIEDMPADMFPNRSWGPGNNPKTAVHQFLETNTDFEIDTEVQNKLMITVAPNGFLKRIGVDSLKQS